jgi:methylmalonyl-CoA/ethylmalonyl-CoA epimerase
MRLDHIGIAVESIEAGLEVYSECLGFELREVVTLPDERIKIAIITLGDVEVELIEPLGDETSVGRFLKQRGGGVHHLCFSVPQIEAATRDLEAKGLKLTAPPRIGAKGRRIAFFHPKSTLGTLIEISEDTGE